MAIDPRFFEQAQTFITETLKDVIPDANVDGGSGINAVFGRGAATINASLLQEIEHLLTSRDLTDPESLTEEDMDLLLENLLVERDGGDLAYGFVRVYYNDRARREFSAGLTATTEARDLNFVTLADIIYRPEDYFIDSQNGLYYLNIPFAAEASGEDYNIEVGAITQLTNDVSGAILVKNVSAFRNGSNSQTNTQALATAKRAISTRTPMSRDGCIYWLQELFGSKLKDLLIIGNGDPEMLRDEVYDLGAGADPRFQIGTDSLDPDTRSQMGTAQGIHVGGRTDIYMLMENVNYIQQHVDIFADMLLDNAIPLTPTTTEITATFVEGTTGTVSGSGKIILDVGNDSQETVYYSNMETADGNTYVFSLSTYPGFAHTQGASIKVVNNNELRVGDDISLRPVFQISEIRLLDPITFEPTGESIPETTPDSKTPGWYFSKSNAYDLLSAKETKSLILDEKRNTPGNAALSGTGGTTSDYMMGTETYTKYQVSGVDFTGYQGRDITLSTGITTPILKVIKPTEIVIANVDESVGDVDFTIAAAYAEYIEYPVRISYYSNTEIGEAQEFLDQDSKRIVASDMLARAFMPVFIDFTLQYRGDGSEDDIREALNNVLKSSSGEAIGESEGARFEYSDLISAVYENGLGSYVSTPFQVRVRRLQKDGSTITNYINPNSNTINELAVAVAPDVTVFSGTGSYSAGSREFSDPGATFLLEDVNKKIWIEGVGLVKIIERNTPTSVDVELPFSSTNLAANWSWAASFLEAKRPSSIDNFDVPSQGKLHLGAFTANQEVVEYSHVTVTGADYLFIIKEDQGITKIHAVDEPLRVSATDYVDANVIKDGVITDEREYRPFLGEVVVEKL